MMNRQALGTRRFVARVPTAATPPSRGDAFVVAAGKGGVGTSTAALLLALAALRRGPVTLVDAQEGLAGVDRLARVPDEPRDDRHDDGPATQPVSQELANGLTLVRAPGAGDPLSSDAARRSALKRGVRRSGDEGTLLVDAGSRPLAVLHALADFKGELVLVTGDDGVSGPAAYALAKLVLHHRPDTRLTALVNRTDEATGRLVYEGVRSAARRFLAAPVEWLGHIPDAPGLADLPFQGWLRLEENEPAVLRAATQASARLLAQPAANTNRTLNLLK